MGHSISENFKLKLHILFPLCAFCDKFPGPIKTHNRTYSYISCKFNIGLNPQSRICTFVFRPNPYAEENISHFLVPNINYTRYVRRPCKRIPLCGAFRISGLTKSRRFQRDFSLPFRIWKRVRTDIVM